MTPLYLTHISIAEPIDVRIDELGNGIIQMYKSIGEVSDETVSGLESINIYERKLLKQRRPSHK